MAGGRSGIDTSSRIAGRTAGLSLPLGGLWAASMVGTAAAPALLPTHPLLIVALCPRSVFILVAAHHAPPLALVALASLRLMLADPFHYALGRLHGDRAAVWMTHRFPGARPVEEARKQVVGAARVLRPRHRRRLVPRAVPLPGWSCA